MNKIIKNMVYLFLLIFLWIPNLSQAAPTDCIQTASDGTVACTPALNTWLVDYPTYDAAVIGGTQSYCALHGLAYNVNCFTKYDDSNPQPCYSGVCTNHSYKFADNSKGVYAVLMTTGPPDHPSPGYVVSNEVSFDHNVICPLGYSYVFPISGYTEALCKPPVYYTKNVGCPTCQGTNPNEQPFNKGKTSTDYPVDVSSGNMYERVTDFNNQKTLSFTRYYNSQMGNAWTYDFNRLLSYSNYTVSGTPKIVVSLQRGNGQSYSFIKNAGTYSPVTSDTVGTLNEIAPSGTITGFSYINENNEIEIYDFNMDTNTGVGKIIELTKSDLTHLSFTYDTSGVNNPNVVQKITDNFGNYMSFNYGIGCNSNAISSMTYTPVETALASLAYNYTYNGSCQLTKVQYPDGNYISYSYGGDYALLILLTDENNNPYINWNYNYSSYLANVVARSTYLGTTPVNQLNFIYSSSYGTTLTDQLSNTVTQGVTNISNSLKTTGTNQWTNNIHGLQGASISYDTNGNHTTIVDFNNNTTKITY